jgi:hypothetical protein
MSTSIKRRHPAVQAAIEAWAEHQRREAARKSLVDDVMRQLRANADARMKRDAAAAIKKAKRGR